MITELLLLVPDFAIATFALRSQPRLSLHLILSRLVGLYRGDAGLSPEAQTH